MKAGELIKVTAKVPLACQCVLSDNVYNRASGLSTKRSVKVLSTHHLTLTDESDGDES